MTYANNIKVDIDNDQPTVKQFIGHRIREFFVTSKHLFATARPRIIAFSCDSWNAGSGLLWGDALNDMRPLGWDVVLVPGQLEIAQRQRLCTILRPDAILFLKSRNWKNHPRHFPQYPSIFLIDDADFLDPKEHNHVMECTKKAALVIAGNEFVSTWCKQYNSNVVKTWVPHAPRKTTPTIPNAQRSNIIMWAPGDPIGYTTESEFITKIIIELQSQRDDFEFWMTGCKNKEWAADFAKPLLAKGVQLKQFGYFQQYSKYLDAIAQSPIGLHPVRLENEYAHGKSFGKILSYINCDTTVITDPVPDHSDFFKHQTNGMLAGSVQEYAQSITYLLNHPNERQTMANQAYEDFLKQLSTPVAAQTLDLAIRKAIQ